MGDESKPFVCNFKGCKQNFANEDHLTCHKRKHEMYLNLTPGNFKDIRNATVDQTPTPSKFIKFAEECDLFRDLNPFEDSFRKAAQSGGKAPILFPEYSGIGSENDSLNTPSIPITAVENDLIVTTTTSIESDHIISSDDPSTILPDDTPTDLGDTMPFSSSSVPSSTTRDSEDDEIKIIPTSVSKSLANQSSNQVTSTMVSVSENTCTVVQTPVITSVGLTTPSLPKTTTAGVPTAVVTRAVSCDEVVLSTSVSQIQAVPVSNSNATVVTTAPAAIVAPVQPLTAVAPPPVFQLVLKLANGQTYATSPVIAATQPLNQPIGTIATKPVIQQTQSQSLTKLKLKETIQNHRVITSNITPSSSESATTIIQAATSSVQAASPPEVIESTKPTVNGINIKNSGRRRKCHDDNPDEKRRKFLERNRAAANRCRQRRKQWIHNLESKAKELSDTNIQLQHEVTMLRNEVAHLKTMLLAHKDCPITLQQRAAQQPNIPTVTTMSICESSNVNADSILPDNGMSVSAYIAKSENPLPLAVELVEIEVSSSQNSSTDGGRQSVLNGE